MKRSSLFLLIGLLLVLVGGTTLLVAENQKGRTAQLAAEGVATKATVKQKIFIKGRRGAANYSLVVVNHEADDVEARKEVLKEEYNEFEEGDEVDIVYLPSDPQVFDFGDIDHERVLLHRTKVHEMWSPVCLLLGLVLVGLGLKAGLKEPFR